MEDVIELLAKASRILPARAKGNCRIWFQWKGKPVFLSAGTKKPKEAREALRARLREWMDKLPKEAPAAPVVTTAHPWEVEVTNFIKHEHKDSQEAYRDGVRQVLMDFGKAAGLPDVSAMNKDRFREVWDTIEGNKAAHTKANWLGILGAFARFLEDEIEGYPRDFTRGVKRPPKKAFGKREEIYRFDAFEPIWLELPLWVRPIWEDSWFTGMDLKDLWQFKPRKHLTNLAGDWKIWKQRAKETETIDQPLASKIKARWVKIHESSGPEDFMYKDLHKRFSDEKSLGNMVRKALYAAQKRAGYPRLDLKTTRHTFATRHVLRLVKQEKNAPSIEQIRRWLGHAPDSRVLERLYLKLLSQPHLMD